MRLGAFAALGTWLLCVAVSAQAPEPRRWTGHLVGPAARVALRHPDVDVRAAAARELARRGEPRRTVAALLEALDVEEDLRVRRALFEALARRGDEAAVESLAGHLSDWGREDRGAALATLGAIGGERSTRILVEWLGAADSGDAAAEALARVGAPAVPHLIRALGTPVAAAQAAHTLGAIGDARATAPLVRGLQGAPPVQRVAIVAALGTLRDERAAAALVALLEDPAPAVVAAALDALGALGQPAHAPAIRALAERGPSEQRASALGAWIRIAPEEAAPAVSALLIADDTPALLRRVAIDGVLRTPDAAFAPVLISLLDGATRDAAADALARLPEGAGVGPLLTRAETATDGGFDLPLSLAIRRHEASITPSMVRRARGHLRARSGVRGATIAALGGDASVLDRLAAGLASAEAEERAHAALGVQLLGAAASELAPTLARRLPGERDPTAFRAMALAALAVGARVDPARIDARWWDAATAPEALWLTAAALDEAAPRTRRRARRAMRRALRAPRPRVRAGAALALARAGESSAWRALVAALEDENPSVRLAAARALGSLHVPEAAESARSRARVEPNEAVRAALYEATGEGRATPTYVTGEELLYVRVVTAPGLAPRQTLVVDVMLPDGRWLRVPALGDGAVLVPDLPHGVAEVDVRL